MVFDANIPMALYKANLELVMRIGALLQESRQRWTHFGLGGAENAIEKTLAETGRMLTTNDWQSLSAMPGATFWKALQGDAGPMQGAIDSAISNQSAFIEGVQQAISAWQQQCSELMQSSAVPMPANATLEGFLKAFTPPSGFAASVASRPAPVTPRPAAAAPARPAAKEAAAKKPSARKPVQAAAKKPAARKGSTKTAPSAAKKTRRR